MRIYGGKGLIGSIESATWLSAEAWGRIDIHIIDEKLDGL
jgi:hypothetical protein